MISYHALRYATSAAPVRWRKYPLAATVTGYVLLPSDSFFSLLYSCTYLGWFFNWEWGNMSLQDYSSYIGYPTLAYSIQTLYNDALDINGKVSSLPEQRRCDNRQQFIALWPAVINNYSLRNPMAAHQIRWVSVLACWTCNIEIITSQHSCWI